MINKQNTLGYVFVSVMATVFPRRWRLALVESKSVHPLAYYLRHRRDILVALYETLLTKKVSYAVDQNITGATVWRRKFCEASLWTALCHCDSYVQVQRNESVLLLDK